MLRLRISATVLYDRLQWLRRFMVSCNKAQRTHVGVWTCCFRKSVVDRLRTTLLTPTVKSDGLDDQTNLFFINISIFKSIRLSALIKGFHHAVMSCSLKTFIARALRRLSTPSILVFVKIARGQTTLARYILECRC